MLRVNLVLQIYLAAGNVYNLENKVQSLADKVKAVNALAQQDKMERLEDQVARTVAKVAHTEKEVSCHCVSNIFKNWARLFKALLA